MNRSNTTKIETIKKVEELIDCHKIRLIEICNRYLKSAAIDISKYGNDYRLVKILLYSALQEVARENIPLLEDDFEIAKNLKYF